MKFKCPLGHFIHLKRPWKQTTDSAKSDNIFSFIKFGNLEIKKNFVLCTEICVVVVGIPFGSKAKLVIPIEPGLAYAHCCLVLVLGSVKCPWKVQ
jgi:hypothetical protein